MQVLLWNFPENFMSGLTYTVIPKMSTSLPSDAYI